MIYRTAHHAMRGQVTWIIEGAAGEYRRMPLRCSNESGHAGASSRVDTVISEIVIMLHTGGTGQIAGMPLSSRPLMDAVDVLAHHLNVFPATGGAAEELEIPDQEE